MVRVLCLLVGILFALVSVKSYGDRDEDFDVPLRAQAAVYQASHQYVEAVSLYERAIAQDPEKVWVYLPLVQAMERANRLAADGANVVFTSAQFLSKLEEMRSKLRQMPRKDDNIQPGETATDRDFYRLPVDIAGGCDTYFALFIAAANAGQYGPAWRYLEAATSFEAVKRNLQGERINKQAEDEFFQNQKVFGKGTWDSTAALSFDAKASGITFAPIFIVGLPGSGKELLERVLSAHSNVKSMDINAKYFDTDFYQGPKRSVFETLYVDIRNALVGALQSPGPGGTVLQQTLKEQAMRVLNNAYGRIQYVGESFDLSQPMYYIDSSPVLHTLLGWVQFLFPNAVIVHTTRDPLDVMFDGFRSWPDIRIHEDFVFDLNVFPKQMVVFNYWLHHWMQVIGRDRIMHVNMDAVAADPEKELAPLLKQLGLRWTPQMSDTLFRDATVRLYRVPLEFSPRGTWRKYSLGLAHHQSMMNRLWGEQASKMLPEMPFADAYVEPDWKNPYLRTQDSDASKFSRKLASSKGGGIKQDKKDKKSKKSGAARRRRRVEYIAEGPADMWSGDGCDPAVLSSLPTERDTLGSFLEDYFNYAGTKTKTKTKVGKDGKRRKLKKKEKKESVRPLVGVEVGVQEGKFSELILDGWKSCSKYVLIDAWEQQENYFDKANVDTAEHLRLLRTAQSRLAKFERRGVELEFRRNYSVDALVYLEDSSVDFIYIDARHDYCGADEDLRLYWSKLRPGGIFAGHDYLERTQMIGLGQHSGQRWDICQNSSVRVRAVKGAVDDFLDDAGLRGAATYTDGSPWLSWLVRKPCVDVAPVNWRF
jgi:tetratricopeptide (TPR) repeat protein